MDHAIKTHADLEKQRGAFRLSMIATDPLYLLLKLDGIDVDPLIDELGAGGARLQCPKHFDKFYVAQILGAAVLVLKDIGTVLVHPVVKWKSSTFLGVEFMRIAESERKLIFRFLFKMERIGVKQDSKPVNRDR